MNILVNWIFYWIFAQFFTNFCENFGELKKLVSFWVTKMSPILVTIIPANFKFFFVTNFGENFGELKKLVSSWVTKMSPILVTIIPSDIVFFFCHQFWWKFWWFEEIGEILCDENVTNSVNQQIFLKMKILVIHYKKVTKTPFLATDRPLRGEGGGSTHLFR